MTARYDMSIDPSTWPQPDDVDHIQAAERYEASDDYLTDVHDWLTTSQYALDWACETFTTTTAYDQAFTRWIERQTP